MTACSIEESVTATLNGMQRRKTPSFSLLSHARDFSCAHCWQISPFFSAVRRDICERTALPPRSTRVSKTVSWRKKNLLCTMSRKVLQPNTQVVSSDRQGWLDGQLRIPKNLNGSCSDPLYWQHKAYIYIYIDVYDLGQSFSTGGFAIQKWVTQLFWLVTASRGGGLPLGRLCSG